MRTYLTRLMMAGGGAVLSGVSLTGVAIAGEGDELFVDPAVLEEVGNLEPCDDITGSEDMLFPVDPGWEPEDLLVPMEPDDETETPWGELVPCYQIPTDSDDDGDDGEGDNGDDGDNGNGDDGDGEGNGGGSGGQGDGGTRSQPAGEPSGGTNSGVGDDGPGKAGSDEAAGDPTSQAQTQAFAPTSAAGDDAALMLAVLAGVLGTVGLLILIYGLRKRPRRGQQPAR